MWTVARWGGRGLLWGAALGGVEMALRVVPGIGPSEARRLDGLLLYGASLYAVVGALLGVSTHLLLRFVAARRRSAPPGGATLAGWWVGWIVAGCLTAFLGERLWRAPGTVGLLVLAGVGGVSALAGWLAARVVSRSGGGRAGRAVARILSPRVVTPAALVALAGVVSLSLFLPAGGNALSDSGVEASRAGLPNIVLIVADTLRFDALGCTGGEGARTPVLDDLAERGALFDGVVAPSPWTLPSVVSLFTSTHPRVHGFVDFDGVVPADLAGLPGILSGSGYRTVAIVGNPLMSGHRGFSRGFDLYDVHDYEPEGRLALSRSIGGLIRLPGLAGSVDRRKHPILWVEGGFPFLTTRLSFYVHDEELNTRLVRYAALSDGSPVFIYMHYVAPHTPYLEHPFRRLKSQPRLVPENRDRLKELYRGEVAYMDGVIGGLLDTLNELSLLEDAIVVFVSDHGEEFQEHGRWEHGHSLYEEVVRVPLIITAPGIPSGVRISTRVELLDVAPTVLSLAGLDPPRSFVGRDLTGLARGDGAAYAPRPIFTELSSRYLNPGTDFTAAIAGETKVIRKRRPGGRLLSEEAYDLSRDPLEKAPLVAGGGTAAAALLADLDLFERIAGDGFATELSGEELRKLRALGYLQ